MEIAMFKGKSPISRIIRFVCRSDFSHSAWLFDRAAESAAARLAGRGFQLAANGLEHTAVGSVVEAWHKGGVRNVPYISTLHTPGTIVDIFRFVPELTELEEETLLKIIAPTIGEGYDFKNVFRFVTRKPGKEDDDWFCSEHVAAHSEAIERPLFKRTPPWRVPPDWIPRSLALEYDRTITTN